MAVLIDKNIRVRIDVGGDTVTFIARRPTAKEQSAFLSARFSQKRNKLQNHLYSARPDFFDKVVIDAEGVEFVDAAGARKALNAATILTAEDKTYWSGIMGKPIDSWRDLIAESWKSSFAMRFEDSTSAGDDDEEDGSKN